MVPTDFVHRPKGQWTGKLQRSTRDLIGRSTAMWDNSRYRYQQSKMQILHKSADTLNDSKDRCHQSAKLMLHRSVSKWNQSADQLHRVARIEDTTHHVPAHDWQAQEQATSQSRFYSRALNSKSINSSSNFKPTSLSTKVKRISSASATGPSLSPEEQIRGFYKSAVLVNSTVEQTRQLQDDKRTVLGEIEIEWINSTLTDAENAANDLAAFVKQFKHITYQDRNSWKRRHYEVALRQESRMLLLYDKVEMVLNHLGSLPTTFGNEKVFFSPSEVSTVTSAISELPCETSVISVYELPVLSPLKAERPIPEIIVTQFEDEHDDNDIYSHTDKNLPQATK